jgi:pimeloyl-ACP methyl ester carboxylesterase
VIVPTPDGRSLEVVDTGGEGLPCVFHSGTPGGSVVHDAAVVAASAAGLRWLTYARPGYGDSTPLPGRTVAQAAEDTATVLDALGLDAFVTYGWSGGGPHALACAVLLPERCRAAALVASVGPHEAEGFDFVAGMGQDNVEEFGLARQGRAALEPYLQEQVVDMRAVTGEQVVDALGDLVSEVDRAATTGALAEFVAAGFRAGLRHRVDGWLDDDLAFVRDWGLPLEALTVPVTVWQGEQDRMTPFAHGVWLAEHVPGAEARLLPEHGHLSLPGDLLPTILSELAGSAARH